MIVSAVWFVAFLGSPNIDCRCDAAEISPFVPGFERFGRHQDIDESAAGRLLFSELSCGACHDDAGKAALPKRGPVLTGAGNRIHRDWMRKFILQPGTVKPGTTMPSMLDHLDQGRKAETAEALTAFLMSMQQPFPDVRGSGANPVPMEFWSRGDAQRGQALFHQVGCVACHEPHPEYDAVVTTTSPLDQMLDQLDPEELKELGLTSAARRVPSVPLPDVPGKYTHQSLTDFLLNPEHRRPAGRMPNLSLQAVEAADIAAWLMNSSRSAGSESEGLEPAASTSQASSSLINRGRELFRQLRCIACHDIAGETAVAVNVPRRSGGAGRSCVQQSAANPMPPTTAQPVFQLDELQVRAIAAAGFQDQTPQRQLTQTLLELNCFACHDRDGLGGVGRYRKPFFETTGHVDIGDEGRLPPTLTSVGRRLTPTWLTSVLTGKGRIRPHMTIRMPVFPLAKTKELSGLLSSIDRAGTESREAKNIFSETNRSELLAAGRQLMDTGCVQCHLFNGESLPGAVGVDLAGATQRLQPDWLHDFLKDPNSLKPRTRMPTFFPNGRSQDHSVLNGDVERQLAAMYWYLHDLERQPLPKKIESARAQNYELVPQERPIVLRTFMPVAGSHAVAVGNPQGVHFAFDAEHIFLSEAWRGRFLDAEGTWFVRSAPPAIPLGQDQISFPTGLAVAALADRSQPWPATIQDARGSFLGYRLSENGSPEFRYRVGEVLVTDRIQPNKTKGLIRRLTIQQDSSTTATGGSSTVWLRAIHGAKLSVTGRQTVTGENNLRVKVEGTSGQANQQLTADLQEWRIPVSLEADSAATVILNYEW
ncbi:MAG: c-type cytochrome [Planctomycetaceae bacterium]